MRTSAAILLALLGTGAFTCMPACAQGDEPLVIPGPRTTPIDPAPSYRPHRDPGADIADGIAGVIGGAAAIGGAIAGTAVGAFDQAARDGRNVYRPAMPVCDPGEPPYDVAGRHVCRTPGI